MSTVWVSWSDTVNWVTGRSICCERYKHGRRRGVPCGDYSPCRFGDGLYDGGQTLPQHRPTLAV